MLTLPLNSYEAWQELHDCAAFSSCRFTIGVTFLSCGMRIYHGMQAAAYFGHWHMSSIEPIKAMQGTRLTITKCLHFIVFRIFQLRACLEQRGMEGEKWRREWMNILKFSTT